MAYEPTVWKTGDVVTSEKLNKIENELANGGGGTYFVLMTEDDNTVDKTAGEIWDAMRSNCVKFVRVEEDADYHAMGFWDLIDAGYAESGSDIGYQFRICKNGGIPQYLVAATADDYPVFEDVSETH